ncbi:hypothetical protein BGZ89_001101, partial [Linnemannia elongata]
DGGVILATLCTAKEDTAVTQAACAKSYSVFCSATSLIPNCKTQGAFPGLPSGKIVTGAIYSVCQEMPGMTDCKICPAPDASGYSQCDEPTGGDHSGHGGQNAASSLVGSMTMVSALAVIAAGISSLVM